MNMNKKDLHSIILWKGGLISIANKIIEQGCPRMDRILGQPVINSVQNG